ncbi:MAG: hypothetical protein HRU20_07750 [Pseudomonadales bacterium]|nr:hypothetical protein [Pseudomonadales bacterium]
MKNKKNDEVLNEMNLVGTKKLISANKYSIPHLQKMGLSDELLGYEESRISHAKNSVTDVVNYQEKDSYILPSDKKKILGAKLYDDFNLLLKKIIDINNKFVGKEVIAASVVLNGNEELLSIRHDLLELSKEYCNKRISKTNNRDKDQLDTYHRIYNEILPWFDQNVAEIKNTVNALFLDLLLEYIPHYLYEHTFQEYVEIRGRSFFLKHAISSQKKEYMQRQMYLYNFFQSPLKDLLEFTGQLPADIESLGKDELLENAFDLAQDVKWMGSYMISSYKHSDNLISIVPDKFDITWTWNCDNSIGFISFWFENEELRKQLLLNRVLQIHLNHDGIFEDSIRRWVSLQNIYDTNESLLALQINLFILNKIHSYLETIYRKIDHNKILSRYLESANTDDLSVEDEEKIIVAAIETANTEKKKISKIKQSRLFVLLESLGCEVRSGKGSEITIYKYGGKHYTMGHHKRDEYVHPPTIINILKTLNICPRDFILSITGC